MKLAKNQIELEEQNRQVTIEKTLAQIDKAQSGNSVADLKQARNIIPYYLDELESRLRLYVETALLGNARIKPIPAKALMLLDLKVVSHYTLKVVTNYIGAKNISAPHLYKMIAKNLELEYNAKLLKQANNEQHKRFITYLKNSGYKGYRLQKITTDLFNKYHRDVVDFGKDDAFMQVAQIAVFSLAEVQPIVSNKITPPLIHIASLTEKIDGGVKTKVKIMPADWFLTWIRNNTLEGNMLSAYHTALIEPPKPWTGMRKGGFHTEYYKNDFIKTNVDFNEFDWKKMQSTVGAVNFLQNTAWEVNKEVLDLMQYAFIHKLSWGKLPSPIEVESTPYPFPDILRKDMSETQVEKVRTWAKQQAALHDEFHAEISRYLSLNRVLAEAHRFAQYEQIYFAYQVDFRGRVYPIAANLHPQGSSFVKPLLRFKVGKPVIDKQAEMYLALQGANTYGQDKLRLEEKYQWVKDNEANIINAAENPIDNDFWKQADEPWLFIAWVFEWNKYRKDPKSFLNQIPIALDGSCNGLQHLSAMMLDEVGGKQVNLTNNFKKEDIYSAVRDVARRKLESLDSPLREKIKQFGIERSTAKRPVMIVPYAGTQQACRTYVHDDFIERGGKGFFGDNLEEAVNITSSLIWDSISSVVIKGREVMKWFKTASREVIKAGGGTDIKWTTPNGFRVVQRRVKMSERLYQTSLGEVIPVRLSMRLKHETDQVDISGHTTSISPNFIHSLDACALQNTVLDCTASGVGSLAMIHDSYGTHAADTEKMAWYIRKNFVEMYQRHDVVGEWLKEQPESKKYPEIPEQGKLNLNEILDSQHFFA